MINSCQKNKKKNNRNYIPRYLPHDNLQNKLDLYLDYKNFNTRFLHRQRINSFLKITRSMSNINRALDIGCGTGIYADLLSGLSKEIFATDIKKTVLFRNKSSFIQMDLQMLGFKNNTFDFIVCSEVLEHIEDLNSGLKEIYRVLKPNGIILISVPNRMSIFWIKNRIIFYFTYFFNKTLNTIEQEYKKHIDFSTFKLIKLMKNAGFNILNIYGVFLMLCPIKVIEYFVNKLPKIAYNICRIEECLLELGIRRYGGYLFIFGYKK
ncbi:MAG: class I SAM-dependent methyltransferase [Candidatus Ratteibacteria bacterium]|nr:class I SAM-dependent methyltransferase [Candidatus Ratteibacteria bacterium]